MVRFRLCERSLARGPLELVVVQAERHRGAAGRGLDDADGADRRAGPRGDADRGAQRLVGLGRGDEADPDAPDPPQRGVRPVAARGHGDGARRAVQQALADAAGHDLPEHAAVGRADDDRERALLLRHLLQAACHGGAGHRPRARGDAGERARDPLERGFGLLRPCGRVGDAAASPPSGRRRGRRRPGSVARPPRARACGPGRVRRGSARSARRPRRWVQVRRGACRHDRHCRPASHRVWSAGRSGALRISRRTRGVRGRSRSPRPGARWRCAG